MPEWEWECLKSKVRLMSLWQGHIRWRRWRCDRSSSFSSAITSTNLENKKLLFRCSSEDSVMWSMHSRWITWPHLVVLENELINNNNFRTFLFGQPLRFFWKFVFFGVRDRGSYFSDTKHLYQEICTYHLTKKMSKNKTL